MGVLDGALALLGLGNMIPAPLTERQRTVAQDGSPSFRVALGVVAPTASVAYFVDQQWPASKKYAPLDVLEIVNSDVVNLTVTINGTDPYDVPSGMTRKLTGQALRHIQVTNDDAATGSTAGDIVLTLWRAPMDADKAARAGYG